MKLALLVPNLVIKVLNWPSEIQSLISKDKNRDRVLFTFPHPSPNGTS
jgi:hypothetical protein